MDPESFTPFGGSEVEPVGFERAGIVVLPLCYEQAPSYGTGSADGPLHILEASAQLEGVDEETLVAWSGFAIHTRTPLHPQGDAHQAVREMEAAARAVLSEGKFLLVLGGDHAVSIGPVEASAKRFPGVGVLQVDAHLDLRNQWNGSRYNHACVMRRVVEDLKLPAVQVGIRSFSAEEADFVKSRGLSPFYAHQIGPGDDSWIGRVVAALPETVYLSIDLDGLDQPDQLPVGEPAGLRSSGSGHHGRIQAVGRSRRVVAADITELAKIPGTQVSEYTAAKIATKIIVYCWANR
jgi:agmatinase